MISDDELDRLVFEDAPYFRRLLPALMRHGFTIAAHVTEHQKHAIRGEWHSDCAECDQPAYEARP